MATSGDFNLAIDKVARELRQIEGPQYRAVVGAGRRHCLEYEW